MKAFAYEFLIAQSVKQRTLFFSRKKFVSLSLTGGQFLYRDIALKFIINLIRIYRDTMVKDYYTGAPLGLTQDGCKIRV